MLNNSMYWSVLLALYVCALNTCSSYRGQKRASEPLELELQITESSCLCWGLNWVLSKGCKSS